MKGHFALDAIANEQKLM
uniref:Uncharacterized protein n=1 Tax=Rhizophora mucronata TaxID=61149 RepID=A0A2P2NZL3_RHIMU